MMTGIRWDSAVVSSRWVTSSSRRAGSCAALAGAAETGSARMAAARNASNRCGTWVRCIGLQPVGHSQYRHGGHPLLAPDQGIRRPRGEGVAVSGRNGYPGSTVWETLQASPQLDDLAFGE